MGFRKINRYHIVCDKHGCDNMFVTIDLSEDDDEERVYEWETTTRMYTPPLINALLSADWKFINHKLYCPDCTNNPEEDSLFAFLEADIRTSL